MLRKLFLKILGKNLKEKWALQEDQVVPTPGQPVISVPWYRSKAKMGFLFGMIATALKYGPPAFGHAPVDVPPELLDLLQQAGLIFGAYGLRDAIKSPAEQLYKEPPK